MKGKLTPPTDRANPKGKQPGQALSAKVIQTP